jgi:peroxiredoxin
MRYAAITIVLAAWVVAVCESSLAHDEFGHSRFGEAFDRGPRHSAYLMGGTGNVHFAVTSKKNPLVQKFIEQGVGQLHGFWYVEAERSFRQAMILDPDCGIAYWGMSLANQLNPIRAKQFAEQAAKHKAGLSDRERLYIDALDHDRGYLAVVEKYPDDLEAKAFEVWRIWHKYERGVASAEELKVAKKLPRDILAANPMHPIHHALIHVADSDEVQSTALDSAAVCGQTSPSIGHMWHMPTHIYFALARYPEAAWQLEASIRTEHARMIHDRVLPDQVHLYAHNNEWLVRTLLYLGRDHDARRVATNAMDLPRHPKLNIIEPPEKDDGSSGNDNDLRTKERPVEMHGTSAYYGRERLLQVLRQYEYWPDLIEACQSGAIEPTRLPGEQAKVFLNLGVAYYCSGNTPKGEEQIGELRDLLEKQNVARQAAVDEARKRPSRERSIAINSVDRQFAIPIAVIKREIAELESYRRIVTGFFVSRTMLFVYLGLLVVGEGIAFWFLRRRIVTAILTAVIVIAAGIWLFQCHLALLDLPYSSTNVDFAFMSRKMLDAGDPDVAEWCAQQFAENRERQVRPLANYVEILYRIGKKDEAREQFDMLRELGGTADLDSPPLARLTPIAREFGYPTDWRLPAKIEKALASSSRPPLPSLGPLLWRPWTAPDWTLKDGDGKTHSLSEFRGKPVLMVFFLGKGCLHCRQQLEAFAKKSQQFSEAGLTVIAVSVDPQSTVKKHLDEYKPGPFPFLMLADDQEKVFQSFRTYDTFEHIPLHGTFLIDGQGFVRWHDVSFEPFMDVGFVLGESKRLLSRPINPVEPGARVIADVPEPAPLSTALIRR